MVRSLENIHLKSVSVVILGCKILLVLIEIVFIDSYWDFNFPVFSLLKKAIMQIKLLVLMEIIFIIN